MATIAAAAIVAGGAAYAANQANSSAGDQNAMIKEQMMEARRIRRENTALANTAFDDITGLINSMPGIEDYLDQGSDIASQIRDDRLDFILGDTLGNLRLAQQRNTALGAGNFAEAGQAFRDIFQGSLFDTASLTRDSAAGAFSNLSVQNMASLSSMGLSNAINIGNYLGQVSGIDQFNPYRVAQDLFSVGQGRVNSNIQAINNRVGQITDTNNTWMNQFSDLSQAQMVVEANRSAANIAAVNQATSAIAGAVGGIPERRAQGQARDFYTQLAQSQLRTGVNPQG